MIRQIVFVPMWLALGIPLAVGFIAGVVFDALAAGFRFGREFLEQEATNG